MKKIITFTTLTLIFVSCSGNGPGEDNLVKMYLERIKDIETSSIKISSFDIQEETPLKNKSLKDPIDNIRLRYKLKVKIVATENCKLSSKTVPSSYETRGMRVVASRSTFTVYKCLSDKNFDSLLKQEKERLDKKVGEKDYKHCGTYSFNCNPKVLSKSDVKRMYQDRKAELAAEYSRSIKAGEEIYAGDQKVIVNSGKGGSNTKKWRLEQIANI